LFVALGAASLLWPVAARAASDVCYQGGPTLANFQLNGTASLGGSSIVLTQDTGNQGGSAMYETKFSSSNDFHVNMYVKISTASSTTPADGMAFVMHNDPRGVTALGSFGSGIGYQGITNSVTVEFDTYQNGGDPAGPHIAITKGGDPTHTDATNSGLPVVQFSALTPPLTPTNGTPFYIWIDYSATSHLLAVYVSSTSTKPSTASLSATLNLATVLGSTFYVGYTASTGGAWDKHEFLQLYATDNLSSANGSCCNTNADCASSSAGAICDPSKHVCGACLVSSTGTCASGSTGCDMSGSHDVCAVACNGNFGTTATHACSSSAYPACLTAGAGAGSCAACNGDFATSATAICATGAPFCASTGYCGLCTVNTDCTTAGATHAGSFCNSTTGKCLTTCAADADCGPSNACLSSACVAKAANGAAIPGGSCTSVTGPRLCTAGVCSTVNSTCGAANGQSGCTSATSTAYCQSGACSTAGVCIPAASGSCYVDGECASGQYCNRGTFTCATKLAAGAAIPNDGLHSGVCSPSNASAVCVSSACNSNSNTCAGANGAACTTGNQCVANLCGSNGKCGAASGQSGCTSGTATTYCQSGTCDASGVCIPSGAGSCYADGDCATGFCRRDLFTCVAKLNPGQVIPSDGLHGGACSAPVASAVCASGGCNAATNTCASALDAACTGPGDCQINICGGNGLCGYASGTGACSGGTASTLCQSGACSGSGSVCIPAAAGSCWVDADCATGQYCNQGALSCVAKLAAGAAIPNDGLHDGACDAAAAVCATGLCNGASKTCGAGLGVACTSATQCAGGMCGSNGFCGLANGDGPCTTVSASGICQSGVCGSVSLVCLPAASGSCSADAECAQGQYCNPNALHCVAQLAAGASLPNDRLHNGVCSDGLAAAVCADGGCDPNANSCAKTTGAACTAANQCVADVCDADGLCGNAIGNGACTAANAGDLCASGHCSATAGVCLGGDPSSCWVDADCAATQYCDRSSTSCVSQLPAGAPIPADGLHTGACTTDMASAVCASGGCNAQTGTCANATDGGCTVASQCSNDICGGNGLCGYAAGTGSCTSGSAATLCQTGTCGAQSGLCIPADSGGCGSDGDCGAGQFCNAQTLHCAATLVAGVSLPSDGVHDTCAAGQSAACTTGLCNAVSKTCGAITGGSCTTAGGCAIGVCGNNGLCGLADGQSGCTTVTSTLCQSGVCSAAGVCGSAGCAKDSDCPSSAYCDASVGLCKAELAVGQPLPNDGVHTGVCTAAAAQAVCATGACNATSNTCALVPGAACTAGGQCANGNCGSNGLCGLADGQAGCTTATAALCQSGTCSASGNRCVPTGTGRCAVDADCGASSYCDPDALACVAKLAPGAPIPSDSLHAGGCLPGNALAVCASGLCNAAAVTCAAGAGASCTLAAACTGNLCGSNGQCGAVDGQGPCQTTAQADVCQSGICNAAAGLCQPAGNDRCVRDADCADTLYCALDTFTCAGKLAAGAEMPNDALHSGTCSTVMAQIVCASGLCNATTNTCAATNGTGCTQAAECVSDVCAADGACGAEDGQSCTMATSCRSGQCTGGLCGAPASTGSAGAGGASATGGTTGTGGAATGVGGAAGSTAGGGTGGAAGSTGISGVGGAAGAPPVSGAGGAAGSTAVSGNGGAAGGTGSSGAAGHAGAGGAAGGAGAAGETNPSSGGCSCSYGEDAGHGAGGSVAFAALLVGLLVSRKRRSRCVAPSSTD
jgi:hypothetical protein